MVLSTVMSENTTQNISLFAAIKSAAKEFKRSTVASRLYRLNELNNPGNYYSKNCFDYYKCIFIHIPKAAGVSISKTLFGNYAGGHTPIEWYMKKYGLATVKKYFTFTFVRNPWSRLHSAYHFLQSGGITNADKDFYKDNLQHIPSFESFIMDWLNTEQLNAYWHFIPQYEFVTTKENRDLVIMDFVGRYENIEKDFTYTCNRLKIKNRPLLKENISKNNPGTYKNVYTTEMIDKVAALYSRDIKLFNYTF